MPEKPPVEKDSIKAQIEAQVDAETKELSDRTLYAALLKRLSTPNPGENEADRTSFVFGVRDRIDALDGILASDCWAEKSVSRYWQIR